MTRTAREGIEQAEAEGRIIDRVCRPLMCPVKGAEVLDRVMKKAKEPAPKHEMFLAACRAHGLPEPFPEFRFHATRKWLIDFAWPKGIILTGPYRHRPVPKVALEIEGGSFRGPGHRSVGVFLRNMEKYNELAIQGWCLIRVTTDQVKSGECFELVKRAMGLNSK